MEADGVLVPGKCPPSDVVVRGRKVLIGMLSIRAGALLLFLGTNSHQTSIEKGNGTQNHIYLFECWVYCGHYRDNNIILKVFQVASMRLLLGTIIPAGVKTAGKG